MLTKVIASGATTDDLELPLTLEGRSESDVLELRNIEGLGPVKASVSTSPFGQMDGVSITGRNVADRNIILTLGPRPNYDDWSVEKIRDYVYEYFMTKADVDLVFETDLRDPVGISGVVDSCEPLIFSRDNEIQVSIICPEPSFQAISPTIVTGYNEDVVHIEYDGTVDTSVMLKVEGTVPEMYAAARVNLIGLPPSDPGIGFIVQTASPLVLGTNRYFQMNSAPGIKSAESVLGAVVTNVLYGIVPGSVWPVFKDKGDYYVTVKTTEAVHAHLFTLTFFPRYGGL